METTIKTKIDSFFSTYKQQSYKKGEILIHAGDIPSGIFYLKEGTIKEYTISKKGEEIVVNVFKPFAFFPMSWAINETPNEYFFEAITNIDVFKAPRQEVITFIKSNPDVLFDLMSRVYKGTDGILKRMTYLMAGNAYARLVTELIIQTKRFGQNGENNTLLQISEKDLAAQTGMTRETVSRELHKLKEKRLVTFEKNTLCILNNEKLEKEVSGGA